MIFRMVFSFLFSIVAMSIAAQITRGVGKEGDLLDAFQRVAFKYDKARLISHKVSDGFQLEKIVSELDSKTITDKDKRDIDKLKRSFSSFFQSEPLENNQKSIFTKGRLIDYSNKDVNVQLDPVLHFSLGKEKETDRTIFRNSRGLKLSGDIKKKVFFRTALYESQSNYLIHIEERISRRNAIPGQGFYKRYDSNVFGGITGWDYLNAEGVLTYRPSEYFKASMGHGSFFIGSGYQSLLLSDYADNFFFLEFNTSIGIFNYQNIFAELAPIGSTIGTVGDDLAPKKYMATHVLSISPHKNLHVSLFESVVFGRMNNFELQYLNPLILYRVVEQKLDSPDNVMLGLDLSYRLRSHNLFYAQLLIDEMRVGELIKGSGWWGNKVGYQLGLRHFGLFNVDHLDFQIEYNSVRPYTYSHRLMSSTDEFVVSAYTHYNQELAHPLGANFRELIAIFSFDFAKKWRARTKLQRAETGLNTALVNHGNDILVSNESRNQDFDNKIGQGDETIIWQVGSTVTYEIWEGYYADLQFVYRDQSSISAHNDSKSTYFALVFRANIGHQKLDY